MHLVNSSVVLPFQINRSIFHFISLQIRLHEREAIFIMFGKMYRITNEKFSLEK